MKEIIDGAASSFTGILKKAKLPMYLASGAEDFFKIWAEYKYDALAKTKYFQSLQSMDMKIKLLIVTVVFALNAHLKLNMAENTPWKLFIKGLATDLPAEMGKRLINGDSSPDPQEQEVIEIIRKKDENGNTHYAPKEPPGTPPAAKKSDVMDPIRDRCIRFLEKNRKGGQNA